MKIIAVVEADLDTSPIGTPSRLADDLAGQPVIRRTISRLAAARRLDGLFVVCRSDHRDRLTELLAGLPVTIDTHDAGPSPHQQLVSLSRKWALDTWRGGIGATCCFDEHIHPPLLEVLAKRLHAHAVVSVHPAAALIDLDLLDHMIEHYSAVAESTRFTFTQAPPGLAAPIFATEFLTQLRENRIPPGFALAYRPDDPHPDMIVKDCCFKAPAPIIHTAGRFIADCHRGTARLTAALQSANGHADSLTALQLCQWSRRSYTCHLDPLPREVEIELTTDDQLPQTTLRPRGPLVGARSPISLDLIDRLGAELSQFDDSLVVLGGFGEPLLHPQLPEILRRLRAAGVFGLAIRTNAIALDAAAIDTICQHQVDVVTVLLDAVSPESYRQVHGADFFDRVHANIDALIAARKQRSQAAPLIVPELIKDKTTLDHMEEFFDYWLRRLGWAVIDGYSTYAGQLPDRCLVNMAPPFRTPCQRIFTRCTVLADGSIIACDRDFKARHPIGSLNSSQLSDLWHSTTMQELRQTHQHATYNRLPLCPDCQDWHRP